MQNSLPMPVSRPGRICEAVLAQLELLNRTRTVPVGTPQFNLALHVTSYNSCSRHGLPKLCQDDHQHPNDLFWSGTGRLPSHGVGAANDCSPHSLLEMGHTVSSDTCNRWQQQGVIVHNSCTARATCQPNNISWMSTQCLKFSQRGQPEAVGSSTWCQ